MEHRDPLPGRPAEKPAHIPVLLRPLLAAVAPVSGVWLDGTFGLGGYAKGLLAAGAATVIGIDRDPLALTLAASCITWAAWEQVSGAERFARLVRCFRTPCDECLSQPIGTTNRKAGCGRPACPVWVGGGGVTPASYPHRRGQQVAPLSNLLCAHCDDRGRR